MGLDSGFIGDKFSFSFHILFARYSVVSTVAPPKMYCKENPNE